MVGRRIGRYGAMALCGLCVMMLVFQIAMPVLAAPGKAKARGNDDPNEDAENSYAGLVSDKSGQITGSGRLTVLDDTNEPKIKGRFTLQRNGGEDTIYIEAVKTGTIRMPIQGPFNGFWSGVATDKFGGHPVKVDISGSMSWDMEVKGYSASVRMSDETGEQVELVFEIPETL